MKKIRFTDPAKLDLQTIGENPRWSAAQSKIYIAEIRERIRGLRQFPEIGRPRPDIPVPGCRSILHKAHIVIYRSTETEVIIVRIIDGRRDIPAMFQT